MVHFSGSAATAQSAFHVGLKRYRLSDGTTGRELTSAAELPSSIAPQVAGVVGLQTLVRPHSEAIHGAASARGEFPKAKAAASFPHPPGSPTPCSAARNAALNHGGLTDDQIANSYGAFGLYGAGDFGAGQRVAVFELEPFLVSDLKTFDTCYFGANRANAMIAQLKVVPDRRRSAVRARQRRVDPRRRGRVRGRPRRGTRCLRGSEHQLWLARRVRGDHQCRPGPGHHDELGILRAGRAGQRPRRSAGRECALRAGRCAGPDGVLGGGRHGR